MTDKQLESYFKRIQFVESVDITLETLSLLQKKHVAAISFENLNPLLKMPVSLNTHALMHKLIDAKRGGYCFEQNLLFLYVLQKIGFTARGVMGKVNTSEKSDIGRTHLVLLVTIKDKDYLVDVGFGGLGSNQPLLLAADKVQKTSLETYQLTKDDTDNYTLKVHVKARWKALYTFDLREYSHGDFEVANWFTSTHTSTIFTNHLVCARIEEDKRFTLLNNKLSVYHANHTIEKKTLQSFVEIQAILKDVFKLKIDGLANLEEVLRSRIKEI